MSKFSAVDGCAALAKAIRFCMAAPTAMEARRLRLESIAFSPLFRDNRRVRASGHRAIAKSIAARLIVVCCSELTDFVGTRLARTIGGLWKRFSIGPNAI
jgi:hypothetical protein